MRTGAIALALALAVVLGVVLEHSFNVGARLVRSPATSDATAMAHALKHADATYVCPMHPDITSATPGECPICGMALVASERGQPDATGDRAIVVVSPQVIQNLGVRTVAVERRSLARRIETIGYVEYDRTRLSHVYAPAEGQIERLTVRSEGERVEPGRLLFRIFSPMVGASYDKTYAQQAGVVAALDVIEGSYVSPTTKVLTLADLSSIWVLAEVFEGQAASVAVGQRAEVRLPYVTGRAWEGAVEYVYPNLDPETRTLKVRMRFDNSDEALKPNMHAEVTIYAEPREGVLTIPREALIETGREQRVVLALGGGRFEPREVAVGVEQGDWVEVREGLAEGDEVVRSGQFLIDSESNLKASLKRLQARDGGKDAEGAG